MTVEYVCEGCADHVTAFGIDEIPRHGFCATCAWLCEHCPDPQEMMLVRKLTDPRPRVTKLPPRFPGRH